MLFYSTALFEKIKRNNVSHHTDISIRRIVPDGRMPSSLT